MLKILQIIDKLGPLISMVLLIAICVLVFNLVYKTLFSRKARASESLAKRRALIAAMSNDNYKLSREERLRLFLSKSGVNYRLRRIVKPSEFTGMRYMWATGMGLAGLIIPLLIKRPLWMCILIGVAAFILGYAILYIYHDSENKEDNKKMLKDIHSVYDTLRVYLKTGTYIVDTLDECYMRIGNKRLKKAFLELSHGMRLNDSKEDEIAAFQMKFDNVYIDIMANILTQYFKTDSVSTLLDDITEQMVDLDHAINLMEKEKLDTQIFFKTLALYGGLLGGIAVTVFLSIGGMLGALF